MMRRRYEFWLRKPIDLAAQQLQPERALRAAVDLPLEVHVTRALVLAQLRLEPVAAGGTPPT